MNPRRKNPFFAARHGFKIDKRRATALCHAGRKQKFL